MQGGKRASACTSSFGMSGVNAHALIGGCTVQGQRRSGQVRAGEHAWYAFGRARAAPDVLYLQPDLCMHSLSPQSPPILCTIPLNRHPQQVLRWRRQQLLVAPPAHALLSRVLPGRPAMERTGFVMDASAAALAFLLDHKVLSAAHSSCLSPQPEKARRGSLHQRRHCMTCHALLHAGGW